MDMYTLWDHQKRAIEFSKQVRDLAIFHEPGTGKTLTTIEILKDRMEEAGHFLNTLIVCPKGILYNWKARLNDFMSVDCVVLDGPIKDRCELVEQAKGYGRIFVVNFEGLQKPDLPDALIKHGIDILVVDESHRLKGYKSKTTKQVQRISDKTRNNYILSGTPVLQDERDLFAQFRILDRGETFGRTFEGFKYAYMTDKNQNRKGTLNYWPDWVVKSESRQIIASKIASRMVVALKDDCLDLPDRLVVIKSVGLGKQQRKMYNQMQKEWIATIEDNSQSNDRAAIAQMALHKGLRLQQILSGFVKDSEGSYYDIKENPRLDTLRDLVLDITLTGKVVVWCAFTPNYVHIEGMLANENIKYATIYGETADKQAQVDKFKNDPEVKVMVANPGAGGTGIDGLQVASTCIYYSKNYSLEHYLQSRDRTYRGGSEAHEKCTEIHLIAPKTIDEVVLKALQDKKSIGDELLSWKFETI